MLGINFYPELTGISVYTTEMCQYLSKQGHQISVYTGFPYYPDWKKRKQHKGVLFKNENIGRIKIRRSYLYVPQKVTAISRILHELSFICSSFMRLLFSSKPDVLLTISPPLGLGLIATLICKIKRIPFVFHVQDLQPDVAIELGMLKSKFIQKILFWCEKFTYNHAQFVSSISVKMCEKIRSKGTPKEKVILFPNWADTYLELNSITKNAFRKKHSISLDKKIVLYSGNIGKKQDFSVILNSAEEFLHKRDDVLFIISGNGALENEIKSACLSRNLTNILLLDIQPKEQFYQMLQDCDTCLIPQKASASDMVLPSKLMNIMALGKPVVATTPKGSQLDKIIKKSECGITVEPGSREIFTQAIENILKNRVHIPYGENGKQYAREFLSMAKLIDTFLKDISKEI